MGLATFSRLDMGSGDDRKVQPPARGQLGSRQSCKGQISQAKLPTHPRPIFHTAAAAAAVCCGETELAWVCLLQGPFGPGLAQGPPGEAPTAPCRDESVPITCKFRVKNVKALRSPVLSHSPYVHKWKSF